MYADTRRTSLAQPRNPRALSLLDFLDRGDALDQAAEQDLRGDILLAGYDGTDSDLSGRTLEAARRLGFVPDPTVLSRLT